jgi:hypothetical protein
MKTNAKEFRVKGEDILKKEIAAPKSINDFLNSEIDTLSSAFTQKNKIPNAHRCNGTKPQLQKRSLKHQPGVVAPEVAVERIHVQVRKDLADKLIHLVYLRKLSNKAVSQRSIIEQALEEYFDKDNL